MSLKGGRELSIVALQTLRGSASASGFAGAMWVQHRQLQTPRPPIAHKTIVPIHQLREFNP